MRSFLYVLAQAVDPNSVNIPKVETGPGQVDIILRFVFGIAGAICLIVITVAGLSYVISSGDPQRTAKAKDAILYAVIGLVISVLAFTIVNYVLVRILR